MLSEILFSFSYLNLLAQFYFVSIDKTYFQLIFIFFITPILDFILPYKYIHTLLHPTYHSFFHNFILYLYFPYLISIFYFTYFFKLYNNLPFYFYDYISTGFIFAQGINIAHELIHRNNTFDFNFGQSILDFILYGYWSISHIKGHHHNIGKYYFDPSTAKINTNVYSFIFKNLFLVFFEALSIDFVSIISYIQKTTIILIISYFLGPIKLHIFSSIIGIIFIHFFHYIQHYGVIRNFDEQISEKHSWDSYHPFSSILLFKLNFNADHHINSYKKYTQLDTKYNALILPFNYPIMIILSLCPPLFYSIMNKRLY